VTKSDNGPSRITKEAVESLQEASEDFVVKVKRCGTPSPGHAGTLFDVGKIATTCSCH